MGLKPALFLSGGACSTQSTTDAVLPPLFQHYNESLCQQPTAYGLAWQDSDPYFTLSSGSYSTNCRKKYLEAVISRWRCTALMNVASIENSVLTVLSTNMHKKFATSSQPNLVFPPPYEIADGEAGPVI
ncbi:hypothetical protein KIN20_003360 [Parelaphostrongylus tenuis]|uniref:Uncharacterized protein n=1 Tax=Parelaphostrongylus tenuis TaxID=148309 RepID=A0AAD5QIJ9_PARTN|nr:hypothetical protein KIN20_003360 [Parelaphostrongylus tenuis]